MISAMRFERTITKYVVADLREQLLLLRHRHHNVLQRDDLIQDVANLFPSGDRIELREARQIDRLDQCAEQHRSDLIVFTALRHRRSRRALRARRRGLEQV